MNWDGPISRVLAREGGWSERAIDKGGPTNLGITLRTFAGWRGFEYDKLAPEQMDSLRSDLRLLSEPEARMIYLQRYVKDTNLDELTNDSLKEALFDWIVNSGPSSPLKALQRELGVVADGKLGPETAHAAVLQDGTRLAQRVCWARVRFIANWMRSDKRDADRDGVPDSMENAAGILLRIAELGRSLA